MDNARFDISVIICVYTDKRWDDIREAVVSVRRQSLPPREIVIVVDNNPQLLAACEAEFADVTVIANNRARGLSGARNTGVSASTGDLVAFLDDDAVADECWLAVLARNFERRDVLGACAFIEPIWKNGRPEWLPDEFLWTVGGTLRDLRESFDAQREVRNLAGGAMAIRRSVFTSVGGFSCELGRRGAGLPISCEDTEFCIRAKAAKPEGVFLLDSGVSVGHKVTIDRTTWRYFLIRCYAEGVSKALLTKIAGMEAVFSTEGQYVAKTLTSSLMRDIRAGLGRAEPSALKRALATILGLSAAGIGFVVGRAVKKPLAPTTPIRA